MNKMIDDLLDEIKELKEPNAFMDAKILALINHAIVKPYPPSDDFGPSNIWQFWSTDRYHFLGSEHTFDVKPITRSVDALIEFLRNNIPNWEIRLEPIFWHEPSSHITWKCILIKPNWEKWNPVNNDWFDNEEGEHENRNYAILIAFLKVLKSENFA